MHHFDRFPRTIHRHMQPNLHQIYKKIEPQTAPEGLLAGVFAVIALEQQRRFLFRRLPLQIAGLIASAVAAAYATYLTVTQASETGLGVFLTAVATDTGTVLSAWHSYVLAIIDATPVAPLAGICVAVFIFLIILRAMDGTLASSKRLHHA
jgi:hypothetical protein